MAMILCSECKCKISNRAPNCPNCGCPIEQNNKQMICKINGIEYDFFNFYSRIMNAKLNDRLWNDKDFILVTQEIRKLTGIAKTFKLCEIIAKTEKVPEEYNDNYTMDIYEQEKQITQASKPKCPICSSTNVNRISSTKKAMSIIGFGILSNKIGKQWHCNNCKSDF